MYSILGYTKKEIRCYHFMMLLCWVRVAFSSPIRSSTAVDACCSNVVPSPVRLSLDKQMRAHTHTHNEQHRLSQTKCVPHSCHKLLCAAEKHGQNFLMKFFQLTKIQQTHDTDIERVGNI